MMIRVVIFCFSSPKQKSEVNTSKTIDVRPSSEHPGISFWPALIICEVLYGAIKRQGSFNTAQSDAA